MFRFFRNVTARNAVAMPAALQFCNEVTSHINKTYDMKMKAGAEMFGGTRVYFFYDVESLEQFSQFTAKLMQDRSYWEILEKAKHLWVEGSMQDKIVTMIG